MLKKRHECKIFLKKKKLEDRAQDHLMLVSFSVTAVLFVLRWFCNGVSLSFDADRKWKIVAFKERRSFISTIIRLSADNESPEKVRFLVILSLSSLLLPWTRSWNFVELVFETKHPLCFPIHVRLCGDTPATTVYPRILRLQLYLILSWIWSISESILITDAAGRNGDWNGKREGESVWKGTRNNRRRTRLAPGS